MTHRLERRLAILRGKREGAFNHDQYYLERACRARVARKARSLIRRMEPVVLVTPRWSQVQRFLDDISVDLQLGQPDVVCRTLSLLPLEGRTPHQAWSWLVQAVTEICQLSIDGPAWQVVSRHGFRHVMRELFQRADALGVRRCLMIHGIEHIHVEALSDFLQVFEDHAHHRTTAPQFNLLLAGSVDAVHFDLAPATRLELPDFSDVEAVEVLVGHLGPQDPGRLQSLVELVGGVPAILDVLATEAAESLSDIVANRDAFWQVLGHLALEIRTAFDIVASDDSLCSRLELIAREDYVTEDQQDQRLIQAGLVEHRGSGRVRRASLRAPVFADLALSA